MNKIYVSLACFFIFGIGAAFASNIANLQDWAKVEIVSPVESNGGLPVNIQDQTTRPLDLFFIQLNGSPTTLAENASFNDTTINVTSATFCVPGTYIGVLDTNFFFGEVISVSGTILTLDSPLNTNFAAGDDVLCTTREMNVDGSLTPEVFIVSGPGAQQNFSIDITRIIIEMTCTDTPEWDEFCDIVGGLTYGVVLRKQDGDSWNIWNVKSNAELANLMYDLNVLDATRPFNVNGLVGRYTFAGQDKHGVAVRLDPGDRLELWVQDDLSSILSFRVIAEGHVVQD